MGLRPRPRRSRLVAASTAGVLALAGLTLTVSGSTATAADSAFAPRLVTVDTPTRADKKRLQRLGLDLTEHAGHDYVEVVLHNGVDLNRLLGSGLDYDVRIADLNKREAANNRANAAYAAATVTSPLPSGRDSYRTLADYNDDMHTLAADPSRRSRSGSRCRRSRSTDEPSTASRSVVTSRLPRTAGRCSCSSACTTPGNGPPASWPWSSPTTS